MVWIRKWWGEVFEVLYKIFLQQELHCGSAWREAEQDLDRGLNFSTSEQKAEAEHSNHSFFHLHQKFSRWTWHSDSKAWQPAQCQFPTWGWWWGKVKSRLEKTGDCFSFCFSYQIVFLSLHFSEEISNISGDGNLSCLPHILFHRTAVFRLNIRVSVVTEGKKNWVTKLQNLL